ncbi:MAG: UvrD-helicase domain-containing protein [Thermincolia bacterium]
MSRMMIKDSTAREAIGTRLDQTFMVEAGAGSGKTTSLVERMAALITSGTCQVEKMAAITFTRKAAGELKERFQVKLEECYRQEQDLVVKERLGAALENLDKAFLGTIHSFCSRLLRERPVEAGMAPDFTEIEGLEERLLKERAWEEYLLQVRLEQPELLRTLARLDVTPQDLQKAYQDIVEYPDVEMVYEEVPYPELEGARASLEELCQLTEIYLPILVPEKGWDGLQKVLRQGIHWLKTFDLTDDRYLLRLLAKVNKKAGPTLKGWPSKEAARAAEAAFNAFKAEVVEPTLQKWREYRHQPLMEFLLPAGQYYQAVRERENKVNFQDLLMKTAKVLETNPEVRGYFQQRFTHLLVDEFQDTDPIQAQVMMYLTGTDLKERDWTKIVPRAGSLFVVGDPKQSIYRFRRADMDTYNQVKEQVQKAGGEVLHLTTNFRSLPKVIEWVNPAFRDLLAAADYPYQAPFMPMDPAKEGLESGGILKLKQEDVNRNNAGEIAWQDAVKTASWIRGVLEGKVSLTGNAEGREKPVPGDFMILVRYKKQMALYAQALEKYDIPFAISGGSNLSGSGELRELLYLLQAVVDPDNPVPLVAALRGIFFGISDEDLYRFKQGGGYFSFLKPIPEGIKPVFLAAWEQLQRYWQWSRELPPSSTLERMIAELGLIPLALAGEMGKGRAGNILQVLELVRQQEARGQTAFGEMVEFLAQLLEEGAEEELDLEGGKTAGVRIMNLHKAKGLEAPVVILANPSGQTSHEPSLHVRRTAGRPQGYLAIEGSNGYQTEVLAIPKEWATYQGEEAKYQEAEEIRLLYVAATRAKNLLVVSTYPKKPEISPWQPLEAFLEDKAELEGPEVPIPEKRAAGEAITPQALGAAREEIKAGLEKISGPTYKRATVTELVKGAGDGPARQATGRGFTWGKVIHRALEVLAKEEEGIDLEGLVLGLLEQEGRSVEEAEEVKSVLEKVMATGFWQRVRAARERLTEVSFGLWEGSSYLTGTIDLVFREGDGWVLVDYKSDAIAGEEHLGQLVEYYRPQVVEYARRWEEITGEPVVEKGILLVDVFSYRVVDKKIK